MGCSKIILVTSFTLLFQSCFSAPTSTVPTMLLSTPPTDPADATYNDSALYVGYVSGPSGRGTLSLVVSCMSTLIICVWTALHLNVPPPKNNMRQKLLRFVRCVLTGVCFPELVFCTAWFQWHSARQLGAIVKKISDLTALPMSVKLGCLHSLQESGNSGRGKQAQTLGDGISSQDCLHEQHPSASNSSTLPKLEVQQKVHTWTTTHSLFATSGGFVFDLDDQNCGMKEKDAMMPFLPQDCPRRMTITASGMAFLARCGHLPNVSEAEIADKSKANNIAKVLVIMQVSWMVIQVLGRLKSGLPVTLLELNTLAHV